MKSQGHIILTILIGIPILFWLDLLTVTNVLIALAWSVLIDVDHVIHFLCSPGKKDFKRMVFEQRRHFDNKIHRLLIFHTLEFNLLLLYFGLTTSSYLGEILMVIFISGAIHTVADQLVYIKHHNSFENHVFVSDVKRALANSDDEE